ncbi:hypothetical protein Hdeb2414_s0027g00688231 [Helianthus debilis subsp. tardiflorus]
MEQNMRSQTDDQVPTVNDLLQKLQGLVIEIGERRIQIKRRLDKLEEASHSNQIEISNLIRENCDATPMFVRWSIDWKRQLKNF